MDDLDFIGRDLIVTGEDQALVRPGFWQGSAWQPVTIVHGPPIGGSQSGTAIRVEFFVTAVDVVVETETARI